MDKDINLENCFSTHLPSSFFACWVYSVIIMRGSSSGFSKALAFTLTKFWNNSVSRFKFRRFSARLFAESSIFRSFFLSCSPKLPPIFVLHVNFKFIFKGARWSWFIAALCAIWGGAEAKLAVRHYFCCTANACRILRKLTLWAFLWIRGGVINFSWGLATPSPTYPRSRYFLPPGWLQTCGTISWIPRSIIIHTRSASWWWRRNNRYSCNWCEKQIFLSNL